MTRLIAFVSGLIFAFGLALSGMTNANKVVGFLDIFGKWDPSLAFVMVGAIATFALLKARISPKRAKPICADTFHLPAARLVDGKLLSGSLLFGAGWGLMGFCPGPALVSVAKAEPTLLIFVAAMCGGMMLFSLLSRLRN